MRAQLLVVFALLLAALTIVHRRGDKDLVPQSLPLTELPAAIGPWASRDIAMDPHVLEVLGDGKFLNRVYAATSAEALSGGVVAGEVSLFIGYFPTQRTGQAIHSPQNCLPGAGWTFLSSGLVDLSGGVGKPYPVGDYLISDGTHKAEVLYWYQSHGRSIANDYKAKFYTVADSIRYNRTDAALVRVVAPVLPGEGPEQARVRAVGFARELAPMLPAFIPN
jgi:EpsI family protein